MSIGDNIRALREGHGLTQAELGRIAGVSDKAVSTWEADLRMPRMGAIQRMAEHSHIPKSSILDDSAQAAPSACLLLPGNVSVPLAGAADGSGASIAAPASAHASFALRCQGDSMAPLIMEGDVVYIRRQSAVQSGGLAAVRVGTSLILARVYQGSGQLILQPENHIYSPQVYAGARQAEVCIEGEVVGIYRTLERR